MSTAAQHTLDAKDEAYSILGVRKNASQKTIKRAYRRLAMQHHPDRNIGDDAAAARFQRVHEAYATLTGKRTKPDNSSVAAHQTLAGLFGAVVEEMIGKGIDPKTRDVVACMRESLTAALKQQRAELEKLHHAKASLEAMRGRFGGKEDAVESLETIAEFYLAGVEKRLVGPTQQVQVFEMAMKMLRECTYKVDQQTMAATIRASTNTEPQWFSFRAGGI